MSLRQAYWLMVASCDECLLDLDDMPMEREDLVAKLSEMGWVCDDGDWLCPACAPANVHQE